MDCSFMRNRVVGELGENYLEVKDAVDYFSLEIEDSDGWECKVCSYMNKDSSQVCEICGAAKA